MFLFPCDQKLAESQFSPTHTCQLEEDNGKLEQKVHEGSPVEVWWVGQNLW